MLGMPRWDIVLLRALGDLCTMVLVGDSHEKSFTLLIYMERHILLETKFSISKALSTGGGGGGGQGETSVSKSFIFSPLRLK